MGGPDLWRKIRVDVVQCHSRQFITSIFQHAASRLIHIQNPGVWSDPEQTLDGMVDGELGQLERFLGLPQRGNVFVQHDGAQDIPGLVLDLNGRIANGLFRPIEAFEVEGFVQRRGTCRERMAQGPAMWFVGWFDGLPPARRVVRSPQPDLFNVRPNLLRSRVCEERLARLIGKPDPHRERVQHSAELALALGKCILRLLPFADIHRRAEEMGNLSRVIANGMASYVHPDDRAILLEHTELIVVIVPFSVDDSLPVVQGDSLIIWMHEVEPNIGICRKLVTHVAEQRLQIGVAMVCACHHVQFPNTDLAGCRGSGISLLALPECLFDSFAVGDVFDNGDVMNGLLAWSPQRGDVQVDPHNAAVWAYVVFFHGEGANLPAEQACHVLEIALQIIRMRDDSNRGGQHLGFRQAHNLAVSMVDLDESARVGLDLRDSRSRLFKDRPVTQLGFLDRLLSLVTFGDVAGDAKETGYLTIGVEQWTFGGVECSSLAICGSEMFLVAQGLATGHHRPISLHHNLGIVVRKYERVIMTDYLDRVLADEAARSGVEEEVSPLHVLYVHGIRGPFDDSLQLLPTLQDCFIRLLVLGNVLA